VIQKGWPTLGKDGNVLLMPCGLLQKATGIDDDDGCRGKQFDNIIQ